MPLKSNSGWPTQGVTGVFLGRDFVSVTKEEDVDWAVRTNSHSPAQHFSLCVLHSLFVRVLGLGGLCVE